MYQIKFGDKILPMEFVTERSARIWKKKLVRKHILENVPGCEKERSFITYKRKDSFAPVRKSKRIILSKEYIKALENKFVIFEKVIRLRKASVRDPLENRHISSTF